MDWRFWRRTRREEDLQEEMAHDLALEAEEQRRAGASAAEAAHSSRRDFGNVLLIQEEIRETWGWASLDRLAQDIRYGLRALRKNRLFTAMAVATLALGIGANTAIFSMIDAILLRTLPVRDPAALAVLNWRALREPPLIDMHVGAQYRESGGSITSPDFPLPAFDFLRGHNSVFASLFAFQDAGQFTLSVHGQAEPGRVALVSGNFFDGLGLLPAAGRLLNDSDNLRGGAPVAVLSYDFWQERFASDPTVAGQSLRINNLLYTVVGVAPPQFSGVKPGVAPVLYAPIANRPALARSNGNEHGDMFLSPRVYWVNLMGRLRPGVSLARAQAELAVSFHQFALASAADAAERATLPEVWLEDGASGVDSLRREYARPLFLLMGMVGLILAIGCANIANMLLARGTVRRREIAVRLSLGASRLRVVRLMLTESVLLALAGGLCGVGVGAGGIRLLTWLLATGRSDLVLRAQLDWRVLAFTFAIALVTGIVFGLAPALDATRIHVAAALKEARGSLPRKHGRHPGLIPTLLVSQIALSLVLVTGAAFFVRTLSNLRSVNLGFNPDRLLTFRLNASQAGYQGTALTALYAGMDQRFRNLPGVRAATMSDVLLLSGGGYETEVTLSGSRRQSGGRRSTTAYLSVGPDFFETMQIPILLGRSIGPRDVAGTPLAAVVNEVFVAKYFPNRNPVGERFTLGDGSAPEITIVGLAKNAGYSSLREAVPPVIYFPYQQEIVKRPPAGMFFELRAVGDASGLAATVRQVVHDAAAEVPVTNLITQSQSIDATIGQERAFANLCSAFGVLALTIACVGLYGAMAYAVSRRTNELGIRMALGAERQTILWMVLRETVALAIAGISLGLLGVWSAKSAITAFLFGVKPADPLTIALATSVLAVALLLAGYAPAASASRVDPLAALRHE